MVGEASGSEAVHDVGCRQEKGEFGEDNTGEIPQSRCTE